MWRHASRGPLSAQAFRRRVTSPSVRYGRAVFICTDADGRPTGAELAAPQPGSNKRMATGSRKNAGSFHLASAETPPQTILITESAIDAIAVMQLPIARPIAVAGTLVAVSTSGVAMRLPDWMQGWPAATFYAHTMPIKEAITRPDDSPNSIRTVNVSAPKALRFNTITADHGWSAVNRAMSLLRSIYRRPRVDHYGLRNPVGLWLAGGGKFRRKGRRKNPAPAELLPYRRVGIGTGVDNPAVRDAHCFGR